MGLLKSYYHDATHPSVAEWCSIWIFPNMGRWSIGRVFRASAAANITITCLGVNSSGRLSSPLAENMLYSALSSEMSFCCRKIQVLNWSVLLDKLLIFTLLKSNLSIYWIMPRHFSQSGISENHIFSSISLGYTLPLI